MTKECWQEYARCWSTSEPERGDLLQRHVSSEVRYSDPNAQVVGTAALSAYMSGFQQAMPGHRFEIDAVVSHHDRSLATWRQVGPNGETMSAGTSFATHEKSGHFPDITGFFGTGEHARRERG